MCSFLFPFEGKVLLISWFQALRMVLVTSCFLFLIASVAGATTFSVVNNCPQAAGGENVEFTGVQGIVLVPGEATQVQVSPGWSGRISLDPSPSTLAEFTVDKDGKNTMDISLVDGFNVGMLVAYTGGGCIKDGVAASSNIQCRITLEQCPAAFRDGERCITPNKDAITEYSNAVKNACPDAYSWSKDDATSTFTCNAGGDYTVTFCP